MAETARVTTAQVITVDGPSSSGKGTVGKLLAQAIGWNFLDSGAIYRVLALAAIEKGVAAENERGLVDLADKLQVDFALDGKGDDKKVILAGRDISSAIRTEACGIMASKVAANMAVRAALLACQRAFRKLPGLVADGRDMGTVVFPDAVLKFFITASYEARAERRFHQLQGSENHASLNKIMQDLVERDARDMNRQIAPLAAADNAILIDTTKLGIDEVMRQVMDYVNKSIKLAS